MFRQSGLMRDKWDRQQSGTTYGAITIQKAIENCKEVYTPKQETDLFQMCRGKLFKKTEEIFPTLELLEGHGYLRMEGPERQSARRLADVRIFVNPAAA